MKVFLSWSGETSLQIARELSEWIPMILQSVEIFLSPKDLEKGSKWVTELGKQLEECNYGLICLTPDNLTSPWLAFEAGALSKIDNSRAATLLFGVSPGDVKPPLGLFQHTRFEEAEYRQLLSQMNKASGGSKPVTDANLEKLFNSTWAEPCKKIQLAIEMALTAGGAKPAPPDPVQEMFAELTTLARRQTDMLASQEQAVKEIASRLRKEEETDLYRLALLGSGSFGRHNPALTKSLIKRVIADLDTPDAAQKLASAAQAQIADAAKAIEGAVAAKVAEADQSGAKAVGAEAPKKKPD